MVKINFLGEVSYIQFFDTGIDYLRLGIVNKEIISYKDIEVEKVSGGYEFTCDSKRLIEETFLKMFPEDSQNQFFRILTNTIKEVEKEGD